MPKYVVSLLVKPKTLRACVIYGGVLFIFVGQIVEIMCYFVNFEGYCDEVATLILCNSERLMMRC